MELGTVSASVSAAGAIAEEVTVSDGHVTNVVSASAVCVVSLAEVASAYFLGVKLIDVAWAVIDSDAVVADFDSDSVSELDTDSAVSISRGFRSSSSDSYGGGDEGKQCFHVVMG